MHMLVIRFIGICCFVDGRTGKDPFVKRVILPRDHHASPDPAGPGAHIPYVEIETDDIDTSVAAVDLLPTSTGFTRGDPMIPQSFRRFDLDGDRVLISVTGRNRELTVIPTFNQRIPKMTLVCPNCPPTPNSDCFKDVPPSDLIAGYFDIFSGFLGIGPLEPNSTAFDQGSQWPTRRLAKWVQLDVLVESDRTDVIIERFDGSNRRVIPLKAEAGVVTIGNQTRQGIEEKPHLNDFPEHFRMYYDLGVNLPERKPRPTGNMTLRGCSPSSWP